MEREIKLQRKERLNSKGNEGETTKKSEIKRQRKVRLNGKGKRD